MKSVIGARSANENVSYTSDTFHCGMFGEKGTTAERQRGGLIPLLADLSRLWYQRTTVMATNSRHIENPAGPSNLLIGTITYARRISRPLVPLSALASLFPSLATPVRSHSHDQDS